MKSSNGGRFLGHLLAANTMRGNIVMYLLKENNNEFCTLSEREGSLVHVCTGVLLRILGEECKKDQNILFFFF